MLDNQVKKEDIHLSAPDVNHNVFLKILKSRRTSREYLPRTLSPKTVSNILFAAYGTTQPTEAKRTAPSAHNWKYIDIYVADSTGLYLYDTQKNSLLSIRDTDIRAKTGYQDFAASAPLNLIYVLNRAKMDEALPENTILLFGATTTGAISQNVYLFAASENLATCVRADIDRATLHSEMKLRDSQEILLAQSVGYPSTVRKLKNLAKKILNH